MLCCPPPAPWHPDLQPSPAAPWRPSAGGPEWWGLGGSPFPDPGSLSAPAHTGLLRGDPGRRHPESKQQRPPRPAPRARGHRPGAGAQRSPSPGLGTGRAGTGRRGAAGCSSSSCVWGGVPIRVPLRGGHTFLRPPRPSQVCSHHHNLLGAPPAAFFSLFLQRPPQPLTSTPHQSTHLSWPRPPGRPMAPKPTMAPQAPPLLSGVGAPPATSLCPAALGARRPPLHLLHPTHPPRSSQAVPAPVWAQAAHPRDPCPPTEGFAQSVWGSRARPQLGPHSFLQGVTKQ